MALQKEITLDNGVIVNYHRVVSVNSVTNHATIIEICSYTSEEKREEEKEKLANNEPMNIFIKTENLNIDYDKNMNVDNAYDYLKTTNKYGNSQDV